MNMSIEEMMPFKIAYIRRVGAYGIENVQTMENIKNWAKSKNLYNEKAIILAIAHDNPETTFQENCRYDACVVISNDYKLDDSDRVEQSIISGGKYAVFKIKYTAEEVEKAWCTVFIELFNKSFSVDETRPIFERYIVEMVNKHYCEICIPILYVK